ncbi:uncharacterized protein [Littorina saxatilis]|uniref:Ig-like domain-containing protein n=1 Tax=Littorina saxatilis TaxID=31220 RepID=A0AAN9BML6_9CAEN
MNLLYFGIVVSAILSFCRATATDVTDENYTKETCVTPKGVREGDSANFTCVFRLDVRKHEEDFLVYGFSPDEFEPAKIIAVCNWNKTSGQHACTVTHGYSVHVTTISNRAVIGIDAAKDMNYVCNILPSDPSVTPQHCGLRPRKKTLETITCDAITPVLSGQQASVMCIFSSDVSGADITLEKYNSAESTKPEEILRCNSPTECSIRTQGYVIETKTDTYMRIGIPYASFHQSGFYRCISARPDRASGKCSLKIVEGQSIVEHRCLDNALLYTILVLGMLALAALPIICFLAHTNRLWLPCPASTKRENRRETSERESCDSNKSSELTFCNRDYT